MKAKYKRIYAVEKKLGSWYRSSKTWLPFDRGEGALVSFLCKMKWYPEKVIRLRSLPTDAYGKRMYYYHFRMASFFIIIIVGEKIVRSLQPWLSLDQETKKKQSVLRNSVRNRYNHNRLIICFWFPKLQKNTWFYLAQEKHELQISCRQQQPPKKKSHVILTVFTRLWEPVGRFKN